MGYIGSSKFGFYILQYVPSSKRFDYAWFKVLDIFVEFSTKFSEVRSRSGKWASG